MPLLAAGAVLLAGCRIPGKAAAAGTPPRPDQVTNFAQLYDMNCTACHGVDGRHGNAVSLRNAAYIAYAGEENIRKVTAAGITGSLMPAFAKQYGGLLTDAQVAILAHGIAGWADPNSLHGATPPPYENTATGNPVQGLADYKTYCLRCHAAGRGSLVDPTYLALITDGGLRTILVAGKPARGMPNWSGYPGGPLSNQQITDMVSFLGAHRSRTPGQPYRHREGKIAPTGAQPSADPDTAQPQGANRTGKDAGDE